MAGIQVREMGKSKADTYPADRIRVTPYGVAIIAAKGDSIELVPWTRINRVTGGSDDLRTIGIDLPQTTGGEPLVAWE